MIRILMLAALAACTVSRRTTALECGTTADCKNGGTCQKGYCVGGNGSGSGSATCDPMCSGGCTLTSSPPVCRINSSAGGRTIDCPDGFACTIDCNGTNACGTITCGPDACSVQCTGSNACGTIDCSTSCSCTVICAAGACGTNSCPTHAGNQCAVNGICNSSGTGCNQCP